jgi:hypothetical protein
MWGKTCRTCSVIEDENSYNIFVGVKNFLQHWDSEAFALLCYNAA